MLPYQPVSYQVPTLILEWTLSLPTKHLMDWDHLGLYWTIYNM